MLERAQLAARRCRCGEAKACPRFRRARQTSRACTSDNRTCLQRSLRRYRYVLLYCDFATPPDRLYRIGQPEAMATLATLALPLRHSFPAASASRGHQDLYHLFLALWAHLLAHTRSRPRRDRHQCLMAEGPHRGARRAQTPSVRRSHSLGLRGTDEAIGGSGS